MPVYEYFCKTCGKRFDKLVRLSEASKAPACPYCASQDTSKQLSAFAAVGMSSGSASSGASSSCGSSSGRFR
jgi:putative FmdB family regulatory protein